MTRFQCEIMIVGMLLAFLYASFCCVETVRTEGGRNQLSRTVKGSQRNEDKPRCGFETCFGI